MKNRLIMYLTVSLLGLTTLLCCHKKENINSLDVLFNFNISYENGLNGYGAGAFPGRNPTLDYFRKAGHLLGRGDAKIAAGDTLGANADYSIAKKEIDNAIIYGHASDKAYAGNRIVDAQVFWRLGVRDHAVKLLSTTKESMSNDKGLTKAGKERVKKDIDSLLQAYQK